jgi:hypothetical protein
MNIPYQIIEWPEIPITIHRGDSGVASWQTIQFSELRIRIVEYSAGYLADHWCRLGHIVHCLEGELITEMQSGERYILKQGMTYIVTNDMSSHRSMTLSKVKLFILDGNFLKSEI